MTVRERAAWGAVGGLSFLVLLQGYELITGWRTPLSLKFGGAVLVAAGAAALVELGVRLAGNGSA